MGDNIILLEIIIERASEQQIAQLCSGLSNGYYSANAAANNTYTFGWGTGTSTSGQVKLDVGAPISLKILGKFIDIFESTHG